GAVDDQVGGGDVLAEALAQVLEGLADGLQLDAGVEQALDDLELQQVLVAVAAPGAGPPGVGQRRPDQVGASPVVELAVGDADDLRRPLPREAAFDRACHRRVLRPAPPAVRTDHTGEITRVSWANG